MKFSSPWAYRTQYFHQQREEEKRQRRLQLTRRAEAESLRQIAQPAIDRLTAKWNGIEAQRFQQEAQPLVEQFGKRHDTRQFMQEATPLIADFQTKLEERRKRFLQSEGEAFRQEAGGLLEQFATRVAPGALGQGEGGSLAENLTGDLDRDRKLALLQGIDLTDAERQRALRFPANEIQEAVRSGNIASLQEVNPQGTGMRSAIDIGAPHYGAEGAPLPVVGDVVGFRTLPEAAATVGTAGIGTYGSLPARALQTALSTGGASTGGTLARDAGVPGGEVTGALLGGVAGFGGANAALRAAARGGVPDGTVASLADEGLPPVADDVVPEQQVVDPVQKMTSWMQESRAGFAKSLKERRSQIAASRRAKATAMGEVYDDPNLTPQEQFAKATERLSGKDAPEGVFQRPPMTDAEAGDLLTRIRDFPLFQNRRFDMRNAQGGLFKLLNGEQPVDSEWKLLEKVFGPEFVRAGKATPQSQWRTVADVLGLPRVARSILDLSVALRQNIGVAARHPKEAFGNLPRGVRALFSQRTFDEWDEAIRLKPQQVNVIDDDGANVVWNLGELQDEAKLYLPRLKEITADVSERTEEFVSTQGDSWVARFFGPIAEPFQRNFIGVGNGVRSDIFENTLRGWTDDFANPVSMEDVRGLTWLLNVATGRGDLGKLNQHGALLAQPLFSPRLIAARIEHAASPGLLATGAFGVPKSTKAANLAAQQLVTFIGAGTAILAAAAATGAGRVELDPRSSLWGKIELFHDPTNPNAKTTKIDLFGGYQQYARVIAQLQQAKSKNDLGVINPRDRMQILESFVRGKFSPNLAMLTDVATGESGIGEPVDLESQAGIRTFLWNHLSPLSFNDLVEAVNQDDWFKAAVAGTAAGTLGTLGSSVNTYNPRASTVLNSIPQWDTEGELTSEDINTLEEIWALTDKTLDEWRAEYGPPSEGYSYSDAIRDIAGPEGYDENLIEWAVVFRPGSSARERFLNPEWIQYIIDHENELRVQSPWLFERNYVIDAVREAQQP